MKRSPDSLRALARARSLRRPLLLLAGVAFCLGLAGVGHAADDEDYERFAPDDDRELIDMDPRDPAGASIRNIGAGIAKLFGRGAYYNDPRPLDVDTSPSGGTVDLFYVRNGFQKLFEQSEAPVRLLLPARARTGPRDVLTVRAFAEGYRQKQQTIPVGTKLESLVIELDPLPNLLKSFSHRYFAGRASIEFLTKELVEPRVQEREDGFAVVFQQTGMTDDVREALLETTSPLVQSVEAQQLGEDLVVRFRLSDEARSAETGLRSRQSFDMARDVYLLGLDLVPADRGAAAVERTLASLAAIGPRHVTGCALSFDRAMRKQLDTGGLSRALEPRGAFTDRSVRAAMRRLGEVAPGNVVRMADGSRYRTTIPIELEAALSQAGEAEGFLALLRQLVVGMEPEAGRVEALRSLIAPEMAVPKFRAAFDAASRAEAACGEGG